MSVGERLAPVFGRGIIAAIFLLAALNKMQNWEATATFIAAHGLPYRYVLLALALLVELVCGFGVLIGFRTRSAALILFAYTLIVTYLIHDFWFAEASARALQAELFTKNMGLAGGLLILIGQGAGAWSIDSWRGE
ncbi:MAG TPA: DoxX family protein [Alphaproteobacteria bacterium]|nr:DoxX family protein [Alphaproteobacteria bacterium]HAJ48068.1 DoxX family protein [Alphaproteobacteria bacterium]